MEPVHEGELGIEQFREEYQGGLNEFLDMELYSDTPLPPDPASMSLSDKNFEDLSDQEMVIVRETLFSTLGVDSLDESFIQRKYVTEAPSEAAVPGAINAVVFKTVREGVFLQELVYQDGKPRWVVGPDVNI